VNGNPDHCAECSALHRLRDSLRRIAESGNPYVDSDTLASLRNWFDLVGEQETDVEAFTLYAAAIGCDTTDAPTPEFLNQSFAGLRNPDRPETLQVVMTAIDRRVIRLVGSWQARGLRAFATAFQKNPTPNEET